MPPASAAPTPPSPSPEQGIAHWLDRHAAERPAALAWADAERRCDYATAARRVQRLAGWLAEQGVGPGDRVALWLGNRGAVLEALFAAARLGAIALPLNARLTNEEIAFQLEDSEPRVLLAEQAWQSRVEATCSVLRIPTPVCLGVGPAEPSPPSAAQRGAPPSRSAGDPYEQALAAAGDRLPPCAAVSPEDPVILMYTSGTTGKPKGALLPHRKTLYNCRNAERFFAIRPEDRVLVVAPLFHSLGLQILALPAIHAGAGVVVQDGFDARRVWRTIAEEGISYFGGVPTMHQRLLEALEAGDPFDAPPACLRFAFTAGAAAPAELIRAFHARGVLMKQGYGQTETSVLTCLDEERALTKAGSVGRPVEHAELRLVDPATIEGPVSGWRDVGEGEVGEIVVRGPITMLGYWRRPEATAETLREGWLRTGDLATRDADFDVTLVGRAREMYISGGENVYPAEVEAVLCEHPAIEEAAVVAVPDAEWGEVGHAHVVLAASPQDPDGAGLDEATVLAWLAPRLARFKQPRRVFFATALPRTASGKVQKHRLAARAPAEPDPVGAPRPGAAR